MPLDQRKWTDGASCRSAPAGHLLRSWRSDIPNLFAPQVDFPKTQDHADYVSITAGNCDPRNGVQGAFCAQQQFSEAHVGRASLADIARHADHFRFPPKADIRRYDYDVHLCQLEKNGIAAKFASVVPTATLARLRLNLDFAALGR